MKVKPIIFSGPMIRALLDGRKSQTRRLLKLPVKTPSGSPIYEHPKMGGWEPTTIGGGGCFTLSKDGEKVPAPEKVAIWHRTCGVCIAAPYQPGDQLYVRETWRPVHSGDKSRGARYRADHPENWRDDTVWRPSIFLPRWASRLTLEVVAVKVERLQEINEEDAISEGVYTGEPGDLGPLDISARALFSSLWDRIHGKGAGALNPFVVAVTFTAIHRNVDAVLAQREAA